MLARFARFWRTLFPRTIREFEQAYCSLCDGRIWWWQRTTRLYSLGLTRTHLDCAAKYLREEIEANPERFHRQVTTFIDNRKRGHFGNG